MIAADERTAFILHYKLKKSILSCVTLTRHSNHEKYYQLVWSLLLSSASFDIIELTWMSSSQLSAIALLRISYRQILTITFATAFMLSLRRSYSQLD